MSLQFVGFSKDHEKIAFVDKAKPEEMPATELSPKAVLGYINLYAGTCVQAETSKPMVEPEKPQRGAETDSKSHRAARGAFIDRCNQVKNANQLIKDRKAMAPDRLASGLELLKGLRAYEKQSGTSVPEARSSYGVAFFEAKQAVLNTNMPNRPAVKVTSTAAPAPL